MNGRRSKNAIILYKSQAISLYKLLDYYKTLQFHYSYEHNARVKRSHPHFLPEPGKSSV